MGKNWEERVNGVQVRMMKGWLKAGSGKGWHTIKFSREDGVPYCTCAAWKFQREHPKRRWCKHLEAAKRLGLIKKLEGMGA